MRLFELIDTTSSTKHVDKLDKSDMPEADDYDLSDDSAGSYAKVDPDEDDPHMVNKTTHPEHADYQSKEIADPYFHYIKYITDNKLAETNPFFPRVYNIDFNIDKKGKKQPVYKMEKLFSFKEIEPELLTNYGKRLFDDFEETLINKTKENENLRARGFSSMVGEHGWAFSQSILKGRYKDQKLKEAMDVIRKLINSIDGSVSDLHAKNMMFRRSAQGIQLVLIDPIA